ncbi:RDD family protein [Winogradskyella flava]|uniref:RDD family protein n=1 Tax=Winogradskyella flava TaxID=1884876 RepID=A0A842IQ96_9FLAO|nr:RDD family protein [Winogradskyella flava]MBC2843894.1 RDD family protein [Winogradskyella flava]
MINDYPSLQLRIKAAVTDFIILIFAMYCTSELLNCFDNVPTSLRIYLFVFYFVLYEPLLVSCFGNTLGHYFSDIKVKQELNNEKNMSFPLALLRFIIKSLLGWLSLLTITNSEKRQAIHDSLVKSVVLYDR